LGLDSWWKPKKKKNYYKFVHMSVIALQDFLVLTFENCSNCGCFNPLSIK
jgi:hypothetical protein